ncbi:UNVERIFIED_CONTAM: hypothetical protein RMT77_019666 [Armadillidium vulgare]
MKLNIISLLTFLIINIVLSNQFSFNFHQRFGSQIDRSENDYLPTDYINYITALITKNHFGKKNREHDFVQEKFNEIFKRKIKKENSEAQFLRSKKRFLGVDLPEYIARSSSSHGLPDQLSRSLLVSLRQKMISAG